MASQEASRTLQRLPDEVLLRIFTYLEPQDFPSLQLGCQTLERRRRMARVLDGDVLNEPLLDVAVSLNQEIDAAEPKVQAVHGTSIARKERRFREIANWDPTFPGESVCWYDEYIQRNAPVTTSWLQQPCIRDGSFEDLLDVRGVALYNPPGDPGNMLAVSPLDDGSICLWDVKGRRGRKGAIVAKSAPGILHIDGPGAVGRSRKIDAGVTECISVDSQGKRAFVAVQGHLKEVDLERLAVVSDQSFEWSIAALSSAHVDAPLTVGTSLGIHLYDYRARHHRPHDAIDQIFDTDPLPQYAPLSQPHPLSILHLPISSDGTILSDDIYVAGRFSNILHYDRRKLAPIVGSIHSGARLASLASLPHSFSPLDTEVRRSGELSVDQVRESKEKPGRTLIAGGEYNTKGSLELYALPNSDRAQSGRQHNSNFKNRYNASQSKILSVITHGTCIAFSDGSGYIKWFERDGFTEVRRMRIGQSEPINRPSLFSQMPGIDDLARKILSTQTPGHSERINDGEILFWTGEKLGMVSLSKTPRFKPSDFSDREPKTEEEMHLEQQEAEYSERMRTALERQADDVRLVRDLGLGA
ncbi:hypothetical protein HYQ45_005743 [Verticillium longisporum]|uniref:F-box domain-containing protein n=1 Tax=Verticillium longisporum TaxID=100787 RepID=A0A8I3AWM5_VERLO|nr:hypothetical protein HYQ45_005743 [Verticillium longisporum]